MRIPGFLVALAVGATAQAAAPDSGAPYAPPAFSIVHAGELLSVPGRPAREEATIVIEQGLIKEVRGGYLDAAELGLPGDTAVIELTDMFVMPGLIDLHVHLSSGGGSGRDLRLREPDAYFTLVALQGANAALMAGFTTVRDMGSRGYTIFALRDAIRDGIVPGPRILASGDPISPTNGHGDSHNLREEIMDAMPRRGVCDGPEDCRRAVRAAIRRGADVIKVMATGGTLDTSDGGTGQQFTDEELEAIADAAHSFGRKVAAHAHAKAGIDACIRAGFDSIEHGMWADEETLRQMKEQGVWLVPTTATITFVGDTPEKVRSGPLKDLPPVSMAKVLELGTQPRELTRLAHRIGTPIALGTDAPLVPHGRNAQEIVDYVLHAGLTPMEALMTGTVHAAEAGGIRNAGRIEPGMAADIVAMRRSPLEDIEAVLDVAFVMRGGIPFKAPHNEP